MITSDQLLKQIDINSQEVREMLLDNLYITCYRDSEISIVYTDLPNTSDKEQVDIAYPEIIKFIKSNENVIQNLIKKEFPEIKTLDGIDVDTLCDIVYDIIESKEFENWMLEYFEEYEPIADYAKDEFDYDIYINDYIHTFAGYDGDGEPRLKLNSRYSDIHAF